MDVVSDGDEIGEGTCSALHRAAANGNTDLVLSLLKCGGKVDERNVYGWTPLMQAARQGRASTALALLQSGADLNAVNQNGASCLALAVKSGNQRTVTALLDAGARTMTGPNGEIHPVIIAAQQGFLSILHVLLEKSAADVNYALKSTGLTPLMVSVANNHNKIAQLLVDRNCNVNAMNSRNATAFDVALSNCNTDLQRLLEPKMTANRQGGVALVDAVKAGDMMLLRCSMDESLFKRLDLPENDSGLTALMHAAIRNRIDLVQFLCECGADLNKQDSMKGWSAIMHAVHNGRKAVALHLIARGCNVLLKDFSGRTAFDLYADLEDEFDAAFCRHLAEQTYTVDEYIGKSSRTFNVK